jgi:hypothetical protein
MTPRHAMAVAWSGFAVGYLATYFLTTALEAPVLWYLPIEHAFVFAVRPEPGVAADFYGRVLESLLGGAVLGGLAWWQAGRAPRLNTLAAWTMSLLVITGGLYLYKLVGRHAQPAPLPQAYVPR